MKIDLKPSNSVLRTLKRHPFVCWIVFSLIVNALFDDMGIVLTLLTFFVAFAIYSNNKNQDRIFKRSLVIHEAEKYVAKINELKAIPTIMPTAEMFLDKDEKLFLREDSQLRETRAVRHSSGGFGGVRIMKGVTIGGYKGRSSSSLEWSELDHGPLFLTSKKLAFMGDKENRSIPLKKIIGVETYLDAIEVTIEERSKAIQFPVSNPYIWSTVISVTKSVEDPLNIGDLKLNAEFK